MLGTLRNRDSPGDTLKTRMKRFIFLSFLLFPFAISAQTIPAGFPEGSVWLSKMQPVAGEEVQLYAPIYNSSATDIEGTAVFSIDGSIVGTVPFSVDAGETLIKSVEWEAKIGTHTVTVSLENAHNAKTSEPVTLKHAAGSEVQIIVDPKPKTVSEALIEDANDYIRESSPAVATVVTTISEVTEGLRQDGINYLESKLVTNSSDDPKPVVLGASTYKDPVTQVASAGMLSIAWDGFLTFLLFIFKWQILFYILLAFVIYLLYKVIRVFFGDRRDRFSTFR